MEYLCDFHGCGGQLGWRGGGGLWDCESSFFVLLTMLDGHKGGNWDSASVNCVLQIQLRMSMEICLSDRLVIPRAAGMTFPIGPLPCRNTCPKELTKIP